MMYAFLRKCAKLFYVIKYKITVIGKENIPDMKGGYIVASNHVSNNDPPVVGITFKGKFNFMAKEELFQKNKFFTWIITKMGAFPVKRGAKDGAQAIEKALESLKSGRIFVIFPEGTRSKDGTLGRAKSGVTIIAAKAKAPVVPVFIKYGRKRFRRRIQVSIGEMMPAEKFDINIDERTQLKQLSADIMGEIAKLQENAPDVD